LSSAGLCTLLLVGLLVRAGAVLAGDRGSEPGPEETKEVSIHKTSLAGYPYAYYTPESELAIGLGGILTFYTDKRDSVLDPSSLTLSAYYTTNEQYKFSVTPEIYLDSNRFLIKAPISYGRFVQKYWGVGNDTPDISDPEYIVHSFQTTLNVQIPPFLMRTTRSGLIWDLESTPTLDPETNPYIVADSTTGATGGVSSGLGVSWTWDTRDNRFYPTSGHVYEGQLISYFDLIGSDFTYTNLTVDLRSYRKWNKKRVLALQAYGSFIADSPPFYNLSALGGDSRMRGYYYGRYRDKQYVMAQGEFRQYFWRRFGYVVFLGAGEVFGNSDLTLHEVRLSAGVGLRYLFDKTEGVNLRMDLGFGLGQHTNGVYFGLGEAF